MKDLVLVPEKIDTLVLKIDPNRPDPTLIQQAAQLLCQGRLVAFPTETVYGLGASALDATAIDRIFQAKQRPANDPVIAHISDIEQLTQVALDVPGVAYDLARQFWPGPLTLVLKRAPHVPANIAAGLDTVAIRMPSHPVARALIRAAQIPIAAPSANTFTRPSSTLAAHVLEDLDGSVDLILDAGSATIGLESTVLDLTNAEQPVVLRPGGIALESLQKIIPNVKMNPLYLKDEAASSPGQLLKHYSPHTRLLVYSGEREAVLDAMRREIDQQVANHQSVGLLIADEDALLFDSPARIQTLGSIQDISTISQNLFAGLRSLDRAGVDVILTRDFGRAGLGAALWDRLFRAAEGNIIEIDSFCND